MRVRSEALPAALGRKLTDEAHLTCHEVSDADPVRIVDGTRCNGERSHCELRQFGALDSPSRGLLESAIDRLNLSVRAYDRILKVARTIADLEGSEPIASSHIAEAIQYRALDRGYSSSRSGLEFSLRDRQYQTDSG